MAEYFCEDIKHFNIDDVISRLLKLVEQLPVLSAVSNHLMNVYVTYVYIYSLLFLSVHAEEHSAAENGTATKATVHMCR